MGDIRIISASAGTGKTYRLARELSDKILDGSVRPEAVVATTFTNKAADELRTRIRTRLISEGQPEAAHRIDAARIGTVNAVCGQLVSDFAFELGLPPGLRVLDESAASSAMLAAVGQAATPEELHDLGVMSSRLNVDNWQGIVGQIMDTSRANRMDPEVLAECAQRSIDLLSAALPEPQPCPTLQQELLLSLGAFIKAANSDDKKNTQKALGTAKDMLHRIGNGSTLTWQEWLSLTKLKPAVAWIDHGDAIAAVAERHLTWPDFRVELGTFVQLVFAMAARSLQAYANEKAELGVLDFVDQETLALDLLEREDVQERLDGEIDLLLVDEFQDTSPVQLAVFLKLAKLARESIWVGDQKQAIYGFRGTDPALMDAAIASMESGRAIEVLSESWRSRPALVKVTSDLFVEPFHATGIPEDRVRLTTAGPHKNESEDLGPVLERWRLEASNNDNDASAIATGISEMLADPTVRVRDHLTGEARSVSPEDIAVLCNGNKTCDRVAAALELAGIAANRSRDGLLSTPEGRLALLGLRYWADERDSLAIAEIARLLEFPDSGDDWLNALLDDRHGFKALPPLVAIHSAKYSHEGGGLLSIVDAVIDALNIRETCLRWGNSRRRLDNLDAFRSLVGQYMEQCTMTGVACTLTGSIGWLAELTKERQGWGNKKKGDTQASFAGQPSVTVSTWHSSKGCEWPVVILFEVDKLRSPTPLGVSVVSDQDHLDLKNPLEGRWVRFWPDPYHDRSTPGSGYAEAVNVSTAGIFAAERAKREALRVLYVIWTRARDRIALVTRKKGTLDKGLLRLLEDSARKPLLAEAEEGLACWVGNSLEVVERTLAPEEPGPVAPVMMPWFRPPEATASHPPAFVNPSSLEGTGEVVGEVSLGDRIIVAGNPEMAHLGNAVHGFLAADTAGLDTEQRIAMAEGLISRWGLMGSIATDDILLVSDRFRKWVAEKWPGASWLREYPVTHKLLSGSVLRGIADLILETPEGFVIIDHKTFPGGYEAALKKAAGFSPQLSAYALAVEAATGRSVNGCYIHLPVSGLILKVERI
jgi:ATP-dependent helicase/nuclease subunit A